jgi:hypothetical protein
VVGEAVSLANQPVGSAVFIPMAPVSTDATGNFHVDIKPEKRTVYKAGYGGLTPEPTVTVLVKHKIGLKGRRAGGKVYLTGAVGPRHPRRVIVIQKKSGTRWVTFARVRTSKRSTFKVVKKAPATKTRFRARIGSDKEHLANLSRTVRA